MQKKLSIILIAIIFSAILIFINSEGLLDGTKSNTTMVISPIGKLFSNFGFGTSDFFGGLFSLGKLQKDNASLTAQVNELTAKLALLTEVDKENDSLRNELGFLERTDFAYEPADVIGYDSSNLRGMLTINKGKKQGLQTGMAVTTEGYLIGRVSELAENSAKIQLITDPTSAIPVSIENTKINGIARGEIGSGLSMEKIPQGEKFKIGDSVITSGLGGEIPRGILVGKVDNTESQENSLFVRAKIKVHADIINVIRVLVIKG